MINDKILRYIRKLQAQYRRLDEKRHEDLEQQFGRHIEFTSPKEYYDCPYTLFHEVADTLSYHFDSICNSLPYIDCQIFIRFNRQFIAIAHTDTPILHKSTIMNGRDNGLLISAPSNVVVIILRSDPEIPAAKYTG